VLQLESKVQSRQDSLKLPVIGGSGLQTWAVEGLVSRISANTADEKAEMDGIYLPSTYIHVQRISQSPSDAHRVQSFHLEFGSNGSAVRLQQTSSP
jgi:hypothetical protein